MKKLIYALTAMLFVCLPLLGNAKKMHIIAFCNTNDEKIGEAAVVSHDMYNNSLSDLAFMLGYEMGFKSYVGANCSNENLKDAISNLSSSPEDVIVFYYFGHGTRAEGQTSPFPQMCLKYHIYDEDKFVPVQYVIDRIENQPAHLKLVISMCCNNVVGGVSPKNTMCDAMGFTTLDENNIKNYQKLFDDFSGLVAVTGSEPGQYSWCNKAYGGIFDVVFWKAMDQVGEGSLPADWTQMLNAVKSATDEIAYSRTNPPTHQRPYYEVRPKGAVPEQSKKKDHWTEDRGRDYNPKTDDALQNAISDMLAERDVNRRLKMVDGIINRFFDGKNDVYVQVLGRNMTTVVDGSDIRSYLRSVALSDHIVRVNNLGSTTINNKPVIKVHEIRRP